MLISFSKYKMDNVIIIIAVVFLLLVCTGIVIYASDNSRKKHKHHRKRYHKPPLPVQPVQPVPTPCPPCPPCEDPTLREKLAKILQLLQKGKEFKENREEKKENWPTENTLNEGTIGASLKESWSLFSNSVEFFTVPDFAMARMLQYGTDSEPLGKGSIRQVCLFEQGICLNEEILEFTPPNATSASYTYLITKIEGGTENENSWIPSNALKAKGALYNSMFVSQGGTITLTYLEENSTKYTWKTSFQMPLKRMAKNYKDELESDIMPPFTDYAKFRLEELSKPTQPPLSPINP